MHGHSTRHSARLPPARQADRSGLQSRLRVLLLPLEGDALPGQPLPDGATRCSSTTSASSSSRTRAARGRHRVAGRRADAHGARFFRRSVEIVRQYLRPGQRSSTRSRRTARCSTGSGRRSSASTTSSSASRSTGRAELHDAYRVDKGGKGSFDQVMRGLAFLRDGGVEWNALTTVHAANGDHGADVYRFLRDELGCGFMQFIPIIERVTEEGDGVSGSRGATGRSTRSTARASRHARSGRSSTGASSSTCSTSG